MIRKVSRTVLPCVPCCRRGRSSDLEEKDVIYLDVTDTTNLDRYDLLQAIQEKKDKKKDLELQLARVRQEVDQLEEFVNGFAYKVHVVDNSVSKKCGLQGEHTLRLDIFGIKILDSSGKRIIHTLPYPFIRRFGLSVSGQHFCIDAGHRSTTGEGQLTFWSMEARVLHHKAIFFSNRNIPAPVWGSTY
ncbi:hypothetical protein CHS0354_038441 [Potamilus streckersoni]|uniref:IRS-type PTB domain-containing protein n=1 Tax=Potamilus streckersoni TaxID=2493646 RepID=A0AAE0S5Z4_9BIVA|nr:hypothetical protein CHS0354_038441 [Potamilus streckersoni]